MNTFPSEVSDHFILHLHMSQEEDYERGRSYWKLNDAVLFPNNSYISSLLSEFRDNNGVTNFENYDRNKCLIRDTLRSMCIEKAAVEAQLLSWLTTRRSRLLRQITDNKQINLKDIEEFDKVNTIISDEARQKNNLKFKKFKGFWNDCANCDPHAMKASQKQNGTNQINQLEHNGVVQKDTDSILNSFFKHFSETYKNLPVNHRKQQAVIKLFCERNASNPSLLSENSITSDEVVAAIRKLNIDSSPGPDGLTSQFYKLFKTELAPTLAAVYNESAIRGYLPSSMHKAVIKLIPKIDQPKYVVNYRPISLLNTDVKIFAHVLAERAKHMFKKVIHKHQHAYLSGRQIKVALSKIARATDKLKNSDGAIVNIDFEKAFDTIDRDYIFRLLKELGVPEFFLKSVKALYTGTKSIIEVNGHLLLDFTSERGVRQGCPLSAILFILALEPLLQFIQHYGKIKRFSGSKVEAYADDVTCIIDRSGIQPLFELVESFGDCCQLRINQHKTEILTTGLLSGFSCTRRTKILGVSFGIEAPPTNLLDFTKKAIVIHQAKLNLCRTLRAKAGCIMTFVIPKLLHTARHSESRLSDLLKSQSALLKCIFPSSKYDIKADVLYQQKQLGGIDFVYLPARILSAKIIDFFQLKNNTRSMPLMSNSLKSLLKHMNLSMTVSTENILVTNTTTNDFLHITTATTFRKIYSFIISCRFPSSIVVRLQNAAEYYRCSANSLIKFSAKVWSSSDRLQNASSNRLQNASSDSIVR